MADNLLEKASILLTPTAYNDGSMLSVKPENGDGDFTFSRSSAATRVNAQGLVENVQIISSELVSNGNFSQIGTEEVSNGNFSQEGSELITNGDFSNGLTNWSVNGGSYATIVGGALNSNNTENGSWFAENISQSVSFVQNKIYKVTFKAKNISGNLNLRITHQSHIIFSENITSSFVDYTIYYTAQANNDSLRIFCNDAVGQFQIDNVSVKEVGQDWVFSSQSEIIEDAAKVVSTDGSFQYVQQSNFLTIGKTYKLTLNVLDVSAGSLKIGSSGGGFDIANNFNTLGVSTFYFTANGDDLSFSRVGVTDVTITNISVKEVGQDWTFNNADMSIGNNGLEIISQGGNRPQANQNISGLTIGGKYRLSAEAKKGTCNGAVEIEISGIGSTVNTNQNNTTEFKNIFYEFIANSTTHIIQAKIDDGATSVGETAFFKSVSLKEITDDTDLPRINYEGFSYQDSLGSELVTNGNFDTDSDWVKQTGWSIDTINGKAIAQNVPNVKRLQQNISGFTPVVGATYQYSFDISNVDGFYTVWAFGNTILNSVNTEGTITGTFEATSTNSGFYFAGATGVGLVSASIDNVSVKEYLGQEVVPDSGCGSWLLEPQSTNLLPYSEDFSQWFATGSTTIESGYLAPDGTLSAYKVSGSGSTLQFDNITNQTDTRTIWARTVSGTGKAHLCSYHGNTNNLFDITDKWQRFEVNGAIPTGSAAFYAIDFRGSSTLTEVILWGGQAEALSYATSYVPTSGATNTRLQDIANNSGNSTLINSTEGVLYAEIAALSSPVDSPKNITISDGTVNNYVRIEYYQDGRVYGNVYDGTSVAANFVVNQLNFNKVAIQYSSSGSKLYVNGTGVDFASKIFTSNTLNTIQFSSAAADSNYFYGKTQSTSSLQRSINRCKSKKPYISKSSCNNI